MKTRDFIEKVRYLGFEVKERAHLIIVSTSIFDTHIVTVRNDQLFKIDSRYDHSGVDKKALEDLFNYVCEYSKTPLEERVEERRYVYELPVLDWSNERLCLYKTSHEYKKLRVTLRENLMDKELLYFTDKEIEQYTGKDRALFDACEKIEVTP